MPQDTEFYVVHFPWHKGDKNESDWHDATIWIIDNYGLPGTRWSTNLQNNTIDFIFKDSKDAIYFSLKWL